MVHVVHVFFKQSSRNGEGQFTSRIIRDSSALEKAVSTFPTEGMVAATSQIVTCDTLALPALLLIRLNGLTYSSI